MPPMPSLPLPCHLGPPSTFAVGMQAVESYSEQQQEQLEQESLMLGFSGDLGCDQGSEDIESFGELAELLMSEC